MLSYSLIKHLSTIPVTTDREMVIFVYICHDVSKYCCRHWLHSEISTNAKNVYNYRVLININMHIITMTFPQSQLYIVITQKPNGCPSV